MERRFWFELTNSTYIATQPLGWVLVLYRHFFLLNFKAFNLAQRSITTNTPHLPKCQLEMFGYRNCGIFQERHHYFGEPHLWETLFTSLPKIKASNFFVFIPL